MFLSLPYSLRGRVSMYTYSHTHTRDPSVALILLVCTGLYRTIHETTAIGQKITQTTLHIN